MVISFKKMDGTNACAQHNVMGKMFAVYDYGFKKVKNAMVNFYLISWYVALFATFCFVCL